MRPADDIKKLIDTSRITSSPEVDRRILADALEDFEKRAPCSRSRERIANEHGSRTWRIIMESKWSKLAVAAAVVAAVLVGLQFVGGSTVTFAQVIQPILNANSAIFDVVIGEDKEGAPIMRDMVMGSRIRRTLSNIPNNVSIIDLEASRILNLDESKKEAAYIDLKGLPSIPNYLDHLKNVLVKLQESPHFATEDLGVKQIDGREALGFHAKHPKMDVVLWADSRTGLPIRIESQESQLTVVCKNLQFDVPMDESLFSMDVPEGYTQQTMELDLLGSTEADFIEGLRVLAQTYGDGRFPDGVAIEDILKQAPVMTEKEEELGLSKEEKTALGVKIQKHLLFLRFFKGEGKWYYRGKGVQLGDADKAIFWYRPKGSQTYRVIYGDLHVEDVTPENLPEPLAADDVPEVKVGYQPWSRPEFVGTQIDYWYILPEGKVQVKAYLTLLKGLKGTSLMPVRLPYPDAPLEAVLLGDPADPSAKDIVAVPFHKTGEGTYSIELPLDKLLAGRNTIICQWHLSLDDLKFEQPYYMTTLQSLIPVTSYYLKVGVDANSGFELTGKIEGIWSTPFFRGGGDPATTFGTCGLTIRKQQ